MNYLQMESLIQNERKHENQVSGVSTSLLNLLIKKN
jgi:hypothetical protein